MTTTQSRNVQVTTRWAAAAGIGAVVLSVVGDGVSGFSSPKITDSAAAIAESFRSQRTGLMVGAALTGAGAALIVWLFAAVTQRVRDAGLRLLGAAAFGTIITGNALATVPDALLQALAHIEQPDIVKAAYVTSGMFVTKAFWFGSLTAALLAVAGRRGVFARWYTTLSAGASVMLAIGATATGATGPFAEGGPVTLVAFFAFMAWVIATSIVVWSYDAPLP